MTPFGPQHWDKHGLYKAPIGFILCLVLLLRPYILWLFAAASRREDLNLMSLFYAQKEQFFTALAIASFSVIVTLCYFLRRPQGVQWPKRLWAHAKWLLMCNLLADMAWLVWQAKAQYFAFSITVAVQAVLLIWALIYVVNSRYLTLYFAEWPSPEEKTPSP